MFNIIRAFIIALRAHKGEFDESGHPYILHPISVALGVDSIDTKVVALLHSIVEDESYKLYDLSFLNDSQSEALSLMIYDENSDYFEYVRKLRNNSICREVKLSDLRENLNITRIKEVTDKDIKRLKRFEKARDILLS